MKGPVAVDLSMSDTVLDPSYRNLLSLVDLPSSLGHLINYLLTEFSFRTVRYYQDLGPYAGIRMAVFDNESC